MNYLAHLFFSPGDRDSLIGSLLADFVSVPDRELDSRFGPGIAQGVRFHRQLDHATDSHPATLTCVRALFPSHRHVSRIIVDICIDHFLVRHWNEFSNELLDCFVQRIHRAIADPGPRVHEHFRQFVDRLIACDVLRGYGSLDKVAFACLRLKSRMRCENRLEHAGNDIRSHYTTLEQGAVAFLHDIIPRYKTI